MAVKIPKFYKTRTVEIAGNEVEIRAWRVGDGPLVAKVMDLQLQIEKIDKEEDKDNIKFFELFTKQQDYAMVLAKRALKRFYVPECRRMDAEELDQYECPELDEIDPVEALTIANVMIDLGIPKKGAGKKKGKKGNSAKKNS